MTRALGIDPGMSKKNPCGLAVVEDDPPRLLWSFVFVPVADRTRTKDQQGDNKIDQVLDRVLEALAIWKPDFVCYEAAWIGDNIQSGLDLAVIGGGIRGAARSARLPVYKLHPTTIKNQFTGNHLASKRDMIDQVKLSFSVDLVKDAADAVGIAWTGFGVHQNRTLLERYAEQEGLTVLEVVKPKRPSRKKAA